MATADDIFLPNAFPALDLKVSVKPDNYQEALNSGMLSFYFKNNNLYSLNSAR